MKPISITQRLCLILVAVIAGAVSCGISVCVADEESTTPSSSAEETPFPLPVAELGDRKAEVVADTGSPDGRLALAWTLRPSKEAEPVDWNLLGTDREKFRDTYGDDGNYFVEILLVDHKGSKNLVALKLAETWSRLGCEHESLVARWGPPGFTQAVLGDFKELQDAGITHPDIDKIKALLTAKTNAP